jgi:thiamine-monophosphate kinase
MSEFDFIERIRRRVTDRPPVLLGIGDDAALLAPSNKPLLVTTDLLMEGTDFTFPETTPELAGRKSLAVNLSDIAAMAGVPTAAFVSVALPRFLSSSPRPHLGGEGQGEGSSAPSDLSPAESFAERFFTGLLDLADEFQVTLAGGDTNTWDKPLVASVTLLGHPAGKAAITRSGAKPGDLIFVTGELGGSIHGHHLKFTPRIREAAQLVQLVDVHAMIDISDGLAADLHHILAASRVGAIVDAERIPLRFPSVGRQPPESGVLTSSASNQGAHAPRSEAIQHALGDGEDFELLFTVSAADGETLEQQWPGPTRLTRIGEITAELKCRLRLADEKIQPLPPLGWQHGF